MKNIVKLLILLTGLFISTNTNAQFLKKLKQRVKDATEESAIMKVEEKTSEKTGELIDKTFDKTLDKLFGGKKKKRNTNGEDGDEMYSDDIYEDNSDATEGGG